MQFISFPFALFVRKVYHLSRHTKYVMRSRGWIQVIQQLEDDRETINLVYCGVNYIYDV